MVVRRRPGRQRGARSVVPSRREKTYNAPASRMPVGYNHNVCYGGRVFHAQTEACGKDNPSILTHLFLQGMVVASLRTSYGHLLDQPDLDQRLRREMQDQHKAILKQLCRGELDACIASLLEAGARAGLDAAPAPPDAATAGEAGLQGPPPPEAQAEPAAVAGPGSFDLRPEPLSGTDSDLGLDEDTIVDEERQIVTRGQTISRMVARVPIATGGRIPFDHPAFDGFPLLDLDTGGEESLELDLEAIAQVDLDQMLPTTTGAGEAGEDLELDELPPLLTREEPPPEEVAAPLPVDESPPLPARRGKPPSLPMAPVAVELPEGIDTRRGRR